MQIKISKKAQLDLVDIWEYTFCKWSLEQADKYYDILIEAIQTIGRESQIGKDYSMMREGYMGLRIKSHIIFYRVANEQEIEIVRILHQRMDIQTSLRIKWCRETKT